MNKPLRFFNNGIKSLKRERFFAAVNILGLSLGMFFFIVTSLYVTDELTHDQWHTNAEDIYEGEILFETPNGSMSIMPPFAMGEAWVNESPGVKDYVNISNVQKGTYLINDQAYETDYYFAQTAMFDIFDFTLKLGNEDEVLDEPNSMVISSDLARKHFGDLNPMGEIITIKDLGDYKVTGVLDAIPSNSSFQFDIIVPIDFTKGPYEGLKNNWQFGTGNLFVLLDHSYTIEQLKQESKEIILEKNAESPFTDYTFSKFSDSYMHGGGYSTNRSMFGGRQEYVIIFSIIGILMLVVATFNYINLTTSRSFSRAKDLAIRKIIGAGRGRLIRLQMGETFFIALIALIIALIGVETFMPSINAMINKNLSLDLFTNAQYLVLPVSILVFIVILSGLYPAIAGSRFNMVALLKGQSPKAKSAIFRKSLIVLQFVICAGLFSSALIIRNQANYLINYDIGYNTKNIATINMNKGGMFEKYEQIKAELARNPQILGATGAPLPSANGAMIFDVGEEGNKQQQFVNYGSADKGFVDMFGIEILSGTSFSKLQESELEGAVMLNESALSLWNMEKDSVIGQFIPDTKMRVVAVTENFHYNSPRSKVRPLLIAYEPTQIISLNVQFREGEKEQVMGYIEQVWTDLGATEPFTYTLVEGYYDNSYATEETLISIFDMLTFMLVLVALLGLFALATFEGQLKEKELSIRKVLGANYLTLIKVLNSRFILLIIIAMLVSVPITQYLITDWLNGFANRIPSTTPYYIVSGFTVLSLAFGLLSWQGMKRANKNPAEVLRNE